MLFSNEDKTLAERVDSENMPEISETSNNQEKSFAEKVVTENMQEILETSDQPIKDYERSDKSND